jgi:Cu(I)/Ag(I) efflux system membrane fusion protein
VLYYVDPMHPGYRSEEPGKAPDCGMDLEPVYAAGPPPVGVAASPDRVHTKLDQEHAGVLKTETVQVSGAPRLRTVGRVAPDEALTYSVSAGSDGWVRRVFSDRTGSRVKRGQPLAAYFSKDISAPQQAYIYAIESLERLKRSTSAPPNQLALAAQQEAAARDNLAFLGMGEAQIEELGRSRTEIYEVHLTAPAGGQVLERRLNVGQRFMRGDLLYRIANLERVWVLLADVRLGDPGLRSPLGPAQVSVPGLRPFQAEVSAAPARFEEQGRTGKLRLIVNNIRGVLVPGMIVDVEIDSPAGVALTVDANAVIDTGTSKRVFVALGDGGYENRRVETGWQEGNRVEIRSGLEPGERVVTAGAFLLDSESRMKEPADRVTDAECGMRIDRAKAHRLQRDGATYYFCSESCRRKFEARGAQ